MSLVLNGSSQWASSDTEAAANEPFTVSIWFKPDNVTAMCSLFEEDDTGGGNMFLLDAAGNVAGDPIRCLAYKAGWAVASTTSGYAAGSWQHACGVWTADDSRSVYLDGGSKGTNTASKTVTGITQMLVGRYGANYFDGKLAELAVWDVALSDAEVANLAAGTNPTSVQADHLVGYWPLLTDANDDIGSNNLTLAGSPDFDAEDHPEIESTFTELTGTIALSFAMSGTLTKIKFVALAGTMPFTLGMTGTLDRKYVSKDRMSGVVRLVACGNDELWYEDV